MIVRAGFTLIVLAAAALAALAPLPPRFVEAWYSRGFYPALQARLTPVSNLIPASLLDVAIAALLLLVVWRLFVRVRRAGLIRTAIRLPMTVIGTAAVLYLAFLMLWGFNYHRVPLEDQLDLDASRVTPMALRALAHEAVARVNELHAPAHRAPAGAGLTRDALSSALRRIGAEDRVVPAVPKRSLLQLYFRYAAIDGMTDPFFHEVILHPDLAPFERPFVLAHEWAHLAGYASEDDANLIAWLACREGDALARYSGWLAIYEHTMAAMPRPDRRAFADALADGPRQDLKIAAARYARSQPAVRTMARDTYNVYLKAHRVEEGIASYDRVVRLLLAAGSEHGWAPRARIE